MKFFQWLDGKKSKKMPKRNTVIETVAPASSSLLVEKMQEIERTAAENKFIDPVTGKEYKTERGLKSAITRRKNKAKK